MRPRRHREGSGNLAGDAPPRHPSSRPSSRRRRFARRGNGAATRRARPAAAASGARARFEGSMRHRPGAPSPHPTRPTSTAHLPSGGGGCHDTIYPLTGTRRAPIAPLRVTEFPVWRLGHTLDRLTDAHRVVVNFGRQDDHPRAMLHVRQGTSPTRPRDPSARRPDLPAPSRGGKIPEGGEIGPAFSPFCPSAPAPRPTRGVSPTRRKLAPLHRRR